MDAEIEKKLADILFHFWDEYEGAETKEEHLEAEKKAIKAITTLVVGTIPEKLDKIPPHCETDLILAEGFNDCRTEMLSRWTNKEKL